MSSSGLPFSLVFPALLVHQFEEYIWPGGFARWINQDVFGRSESEFPFTRNLAFVINIPIGWSLFGVVAWKGAEWSSFALILCGILLVNSWFHLVLAITRMQYNPGAATSLFVVLPVMLYVFYDAIRSLSATFDRVLLAIAIGILFHIAITTLPRRIRSVS